MHATRRNKDKISHFFGNVLSSAEVEIKSDRCMVMEGKAMLTIRIKKTHNKIKK